MLTGFCFRRESYRGPCQHVHFVHWEFPSSRYGERRNIVKFSQKIKLSKIYHTLLTNSLNREETITITLTKSFSLMFQDFQLSFYFRQQWRDARLAYKNHFHEEKITLGGAILKQLWLPQTYFVNKKGASASTDANFFVRIFPDGSVLVITKYVEKDFRLNLAGVKLVLFYLFLWFLNKNCAQLDWELNSIVTCQTAF